MVLAAGKSNDVSAESLGGASLSTQDFSLLGTKVISWQLWQCPWTHGKHLNIFTALAKNLNRDKRYALAYIIHLEQKAEAMVLSQYIKSQAEPHSLLSAELGSFGFGTPIFTITVFGTLIVLAVFYDVSPAEALRVGSRGALSSTGVKGFDRSYPR